MTEIKTENNEKKRRFIIYENDEFVGELTYKYE